MSNIQSNCPYCDSQTFKGMAIKGAGENDWINQCIQCEMFSLNIEDGTQIKIEEQSKFKDSDFEVKVRPAEHGKVYKGISKQNAKNINVEKSLEQVNHFHNQVFKRKHVRCSECMATQRLEDNTVLTDGWPICCDKAMEYHALTKDIPEKERNSYERAHSTGKSLVISPITK